MQTYDRLVEKLNDRIDKAVTARAILDETKKTLNDLKEKKESTPPSNKTLCNPQTDEDEEDDLTKMITLIEKKRRKWEARLTLANRSRKRIEKLLKIKETERFNESNWSK